MFSNNSYHIDINNSDIKIPEFLQNREIKNSDILILRNFFEKNNISNFSEITIHMLNQFVRFEYEKIIQICTLLGLYGVEFIGEASKYHSPNSRNVVSLLAAQKNLSINETKIFLNNYQDIEFRILEYLKKIGITTTEQITGINLSVLLDKLNILDLNIEDLEKDLNSDYFTVVKNNFEQLYPVLHNEKTTIKKKKIYKEDCVSIEKLQQLNLYRLKKFKISKTKQLLNFCHTRKH